MKITKGLIIADPWMEYILDGIKDWEMRASNASHRGWFCLIRRGTGAVYGVANLTDVGKPLSPREMVATFEHHRIPERMISSGEVAKWNTPWKLTNVRRLKHPVPYRHKNGAVTWVDLEDEAIDGVARQIDGEVVEGNEEDNIINAPVMGQARSRASIIEVDVAQRGRNVWIDVRWDNGNIRDATTAKPIKKQPVFVESQPRLLSVEAGMMGEAKRVIGEVVLTEGNINNNHFYLQSFLHHFPKDVIGGPNRQARAEREVAIEWGGDKPAKTDIDGQKKFFRARGWIGDFFQLHGAKAGHRVLVEEVAPYSYKVSLKR